jgi:hypothetical protein
VPDLADRESYLTLGEAIEWLRTVDPTLVDQVALDKLIELCRLHGVRAIGLQCEPPSRPYLKMGRPKEGLEPIPAYDWADLRFGYDQGEDAPTDDLLSIRFKRRMWVDVLFSKADLTRVLAAPSDTTTGTEDDHKPSPPTRRPSKSVADMTAALEGLEREGQIRPGMTKGEKHRLVLERLGIKDKQRGYQYENFRKNVLPSS